MYLRIPYLNMDMDTMDVSLLSECAPPPIHFLLSRAPSPLFLRLVLRNVILDL